MQKRNLFTLVELLVVVGIIAILAGMILPAVVDAQQQGRITQAKSDMTSITMALKSMEDNYGRMITKDGDKVQFYNLSSKISADNGRFTIGAYGRKATDDTTKSSTYEDAYDAYIAELTVPQTMSTSSSSKSTNKKKMNTNKRKISFLAPQPGYDPAKQYTNSNNKLKLWRDPWGSRYCIMFQASSSEYMVDPRYEKESSPKRIASNVAIYSIGPNGADDKGENVEQGGDPGTDDIINWE